MAAYRHCFNAEQLVTFVSFNVLQGVTFIIAVKLSQC